MNNEMFGLFQFQQTRTSLNVSALNIISITGSDKINFHKHSKYPNLLN